MALIADDVASQLKEEFAALVNPVRLAVFSQALADPDSEQVKRLVEELGALDPRLAAESYNFILDTEKVERLTKPLVLNPFFGYKEEDRNILNPFMDETVKEFSSIDGAFVIRGDGVVEAAGALIQATDSSHALPSGLGSRHAAAAAISVTANCISIVVSSSTGQVTLFRRGVMVPLTEKRR